MKKYVMVPVYFLEMLEENLKKEGIKDSTIPTSLKWIIENGEEVPLELVRGITKRELAEARYPEGTTGIDYALPLQLVRIIKERLDYDPVPDFVMDCRGPFKLSPITKIGEAMLPVINKVVLNSSMY